MDDPSTSDARGLWVWNQQDHLTHRLRLSAAYHGRRERFFNFTERTLQAFVVIAATGAFADVFGRAECATGGVSVARWLALAAAIASIVPLVFNLAGNAQRHGQLKSGFKSILSALYGEGTELSEEKLVEYKAKVAQLEAGEPAPMSGVVVACENEILTQEEKPTFPLTIGERLMMHFIPLDSARIVARGKAKAKEEAERSEKAATPRAV